MELSRHSRRFRSAQRWLGLAAAAMLLLGTVGCASRRVAPVVIEHQVPPVDKSGNQIRIKLVTYNIWGLPSWMTGARKGRYPEIARELERLKPDLVLLQEVWTAEARQAIPTNGLWAITRAAGQHTFFQQNGLVILSRFPVIGGQFYPFSQAAFPDRAVNKGMLKVTVVVPGGGLLNVWDVHMQDGGSLELRRSQARELIEHVQAAEDGQIADVVGGDFNCTPDSAPFRELEAAFGPTVQQMGGTQPFVTWDGLSDKPGDGEILDHIFVRPRAIFQDLHATQHVAFQANTKTDRLSDHFGIEADLGLTPAANLAKVVRTFTGESSTPPAAKASPLDN
jgi:endonuclease/exonuclease/phosphatase family metal-dependent hydrolase